MSKFLALAGLDALLPLFQTISIQGTTVNDFGFLETHRNKCKWCSRRFECMISYPNFWTTWCGSCWAAAFALLNSSPTVGRKTCQQWISMNNHDRKWRKCIYKCTPVASSIQVSLLCWKVEAQLLCWAAGSRQDSVACVHDHSDAAPWQTEGCWSVMPLCIC